MLSLSLLGARARLLRAPAASRCVSTVARSLGNSAAVVSAPRARFEAPKSRLFSTVDGPKDGDEDEGKKDELQDQQDQPINDDLSPLERLMQHSQQFRVDLDLDDEDAGYGQGDDDNGDDEQDDGPFASDWQAERSSSSNSRTSGNSSSTRPAAGFKRNTFRRRGASDRHSQLGRMAVSRLLEKDMDELNYDAELESVWGEQELKQRKFHQHLRREQDRDHVCQNCGERGHRSRNCLVPRICSNCGNLGHSANQCRYRKSPESIDEFLEREEDFQARQKKSRRFRKKAAKAAEDPRAPRPKDMPMSDFNKRNESLRLELDAELDAYADMLEEKDRKRKEQEQLKETQVTPPTEH
ncbi:Gag-Pol polyprotein [Phytophthora cinnamomi]|uniref:Gag-Pol polyprotein n=1 Tax=Phytophthora cinnamomi TaxID=4785 RepID=UPI00355989C1|nr:Gag-Pol polyprotein [Phytophthora cinnamomi]